MKREDINRVVANNLTLLMAATPKLSSQPKVARKSGVGQTTIGRILREEVDASVGTLERIAQAFGLFAHELSDPQLQHRVRSERAEYKVAREIHGPLVPWLDMSDANTWVKEPKAAEKTIKQWLSSPFLVSKRAFCVQAQGPSMAPEYRDTEFVVADPEIQPEHGSDIIVSVDHGKSTMLRRFQHTYEGPFLVALNDDWPNRLKPMDADSTTVLATVVGSWLSRHKEQDSNDF